MNRYHSTKKVAILGIFSNIILLALKLTVGFFSRSQAMIADGFNSAGDVFASIMTYAGNKIASQPEDKNHPYGHGKAEYVFSMIISFSLVLVAYKIFRSSLDSILYREKLVFSMWLLGIAIITIGLKSFLFIYTRNIGKLEDSLLILANSEDHRNDIFITSSTLIGIIASLYGVYWLDGVVGVGISFWIAYTAIKIFLNAYKVLMDTNLDEQTRETIMKTIEKIHGIEHVDDINAKPVGIHYILLVKISVDGNISVNEGHRIAGNVKRELKQCKKIADVIVHVNPA